MAVVILGATFSALSGIIAAEPLPVQNNNLQPGRYSISAVSDGTYAYIFGGRDGANRLTNIDRYDFASGSLAASGASFNTGRSATSAVIAGSTAYVFGGVDNDAAAIKQIYKFSATSGPAFPVADLPQAAFESSAAWTGSKAYVFGGKDSSANHLSSIVEFDPNNGNAVRELNPGLPAKRGASAAAWDGTYAWVFGGYDGAVMDTILRFNPNDGSTVQIGTRLPSARMLMSAAYDGSKYVYIFGGDKSNGSTNEILRFDTKTEQLSTLPQTLPTARRLTAATWSAPLSAAYIFGGLDTDDSVLKEVVKLAIIPTTPQNVVATSGPALGHVTLTWDAVGAVSGYKIWRGTASPVSTAGPAFATAVASATSYVDTSGTPGTRYYYKIAAYNANGDSTAAEVNALAANVPGTPSNFQVTPGPARGQISVSWGAPSDDGGMAVSNYIVYRGSTSNTIQPYKTLGNELSFADSGLADGVTECYALSAKNGVGEGGKTVTTCVKSPYLPGPPQNLVQGRSPAAKKVKVDWAQPADTGGVSIQRYYVSRSLSAGGPTEAGFPRDVGAVLTWTDDLAQDCAFRWYKVRAENVVGQSSWSAEKQMRSPCVPSTPLDAQAQPGAIPTQIATSWATPADDGGLDIQGYRLYRTTVREGPLFLEDDVSAATFSATDLPLIPGVRYYYRVAAYNALGLGAYSPWMSARASVLVPGVDRDGDAIPDLVESRVCSTAATTLLLNSLSGIAGHCATPFDLVAQSGLDADEDWIPDEAEFLVCAVQDNSDPLDGICVDHDGNGEQEDWGWPPVDVVDVL